MWESHVEKEHYSYLILTTFIEFSSVIKQTRCFFLKLIFSNSYLTTISIVSFSLTCKSMAVWELIKLSQLKNGIIFVFYVGLPHIFHSPYNTVKPGLSCVQYILIMTVCFCFSYSEKRECLLYKKLSDWHSSIITRFCWNTLWYIVTKNFTVQRGGGGGGEVRDCP